MTYLHGSHFLPELAPYVESSQPYEGKRFIDAKNWTSTILGGVAASAILVPSVTHLNEAIRASATASAFAAGGAPSAALALGATTFALELTGGIVAADALDTQAGNKFTAFLGKALQKIHIKEVPETNLLADAATTFIIGTPLTIAIKKQQDKSRTRRENRQFALGSASYLGAVIGAQGYAIAEGIQHPDPLTLSIAALAVGATVVGVSKFNKKQKQSADIKPLLPDKILWPRYDLREEELKALENEMVTLAAEKYPKRIVGMWISPQSKYANLIRHEEAKHFPETAGLDGVTEDSTTFLALIDTRPDVMRVVHGATVTNYASNAPTDESDSPKTGIYTVDSLIDLENFTAEEFKDFYTEKGVNLKKSFSCETNFRIGERTRDYKKMRPSDLAYMLLIDRVLKNDPRMSEGAVFASINRPSIVSFNRVGIDYEPLMGRKDLVTEESKMETPRFSLPIAILPSKANRSKLRTLIYGAKLFGAFPPVIQA